MKIMRGLMMALAVAAVAGLSATADAAPKKSKKAMKPMKPTIALRGCATYGVPPFCLYMRGPAPDRTMYALVSVPPSFTPGYPVQVIGNPGGDSLCFGTPLTVVAWKPLKGLCPP